MSVEFDYDPDSEEAYQRQVLEEVRREAVQNSLFGKHIRRVSFESTSNGRGRKKRRGRDVDLLRVGERTYQIKDGELKSRKGGGIRPDVLANELLQFLPPEERTPEKLLELLEVFNH